MNKQTLLGLALGAVGCAASATTIDTPAVSYGLVAPTWLQNLQLAQFDSDLGTLTSVTYDIEVYISGTGNATNGDMGPADIIFNYGGTFRFRNLSSGATTFSLLPEATATFEAVPSGNSTGIDSFDVTLSYYIPDSGTQGSVPGTEWGEFQAPGGGLVPIEVRATSTSTAEGPETVTSTFTSLASAEVTLHYTYTPSSGEVPEPGTYVGAAGLLGIGALAYRRARKARA